MCVDAALIDPQRIHLAAQRDFAAERVDHFGPGRRHRGGIIAQRGADAARDRRPGAQFAIGERGGKATLQYQPRIGRAAALEFVDQLGAQVRPEAVGRIAPHGRAAVGVPAEVRVKGHDWNSHDQYRGHSSAAAPPENVGW